MGDFDHPLFIPLFFFGNESMFIGKAMGPILSVFKHPYKNLTHTAFNIDGNILAKEFILDCDNSIDYIHLVNQLNVVAVQVQFKLAILNHDWELGQLNLTPEECLEHSIGINFDIILLYWYALQLSSTFIPVMPPLEESMKLIQEPVGRYMALSNRMNSKSFRHYVNGTLGKTIAPQELDILARDGLPPILQINKVNLTINMAGVDHDEMVAWASPKYDALTIDAVVRIKAFTTNLTDIFNAYDEVEIKTSLDVEALVMRLLYALSYSYVGEDIYNLTWLDYNSRKGFDVKSNGSNHEYAMYRDSNIINNTTTIAGVGKSLS